MFAHGVYHDNDVAYGVDHKDGRQLVAIVSKITAFLTIKLYY